MKLDLAWFNRGDLSRRPIQLRAMKDIEKRAKENSMVSRARWFFTSALMALKSSRKPTA